MKEWLETALARSGVAVVPLEPAVAFESARLIDSLRDPADCQIVGTALHLGVRWPRATPESSKRPRA